MIRWKTYCFRKNDNRFHQAEIFSNNGMTFLKLNNEAYSPGKFSYLMSVIRIMPKKLSIYKYNITYQIIQQINLVDLFSFFIESILKFHKLLERSIILRVIFGLYFEIAFPLTLSICYTVKVKQGDSTLFSLVVSVYGKFLSSFLTFTS